MITHEIAVCLEVTIFFMWLLVSLDGSVHTHVIAPALMVFEAYSNRIPFYLKDAAILTLVLLSYLVVNYCTTKYWFIVYGMLDYTTPMTGVYIVLALVIALSTLAIGKISRQTMWMGPLQQSFAQSTNLPQVSGEAGVPSSQSLQGREIGGLSEQA